MFYSELLLTECSEAEMGEGARKPPRWHTSGKAVGVASTSLRLFASRANEGQEEGP